MTYSASSKDEAMRWAADMKAQGYSHVRVSKLRGYWNVVWSPRRTAKRDSETGRAGTQFAGRPRKNPTTKLQRMVESQKRRNERRVSEALAAYLKAVAKKKNPASNVKLVGARVEHLKGGALKITPVKSSKGKK